jgi:hypothetical protein
MPFIQNDRNHASTIMATLSKLSAPVINCLIKSVSFNFKITASKTEEPGKRGSHFATTSRA